MILLLVPLIIFTLISIDFLLKVDSAEGVDAAIQELSTQFDKLLQTNKNPSSDSGKATAAEHVVLTLYQVVYVLSCSAHMFH